MKNYTDLTFIVDRSWSMKRIKEAMESGAKEFLDKERASGDDTVVSVVYYDDQYEFPVLTESIKTVKDIVIEPRGNTALLDAIGKTVKRVGERLAKMKEKDRPNRVLIVSVTDGEENASHEFTKNDIKEMVQHQREKYAWDFAFFGANIDAFGEGAKMGIQRGSTMSFAATNEGVKDMWSKFERSYTGYKGLDRTVCRAATFSVVDDEDDDKGK